MMQGKQKARAAVGVFVRLQSVRTCLCPDLTDHFQKAHFESALLVNASSPGTRATIL